MKNTTLLIMAAGIGSRFGTGIKQLATVDSSNHIIMDYSIHDAIEVGFNKIIFIIRRDIEREFKEVIGDRIEKTCEEHGVEVAYAYQSIDKIPGELPIGRTKPWGTGQAVLAAKELIDSPFAVINADDYYGKEAYRAMHDWLVHEHEANAYAMAGFILKNTLSDNGGVTRGVCKVEDGHTHVIDVVETSNIVKVNGGAEADGVVLDTESFVSMNFWGFPGNPPEFLKVLEDGFVEFFETEVPFNPLESEYLLPTIIGGMLEKNTCAVRVLPTSDTWYGMTYQEDVVAVKKAFTELLKTGVYKEELFSDLSIVNFKTDIFEGVQPPRNTTFNLIGLKMPSNQDVYFMSKWHELFERYEMARIFLGKTQEDNWDYWFNKVDDEKTQRGIELVFKSQMLETALMHYNIIVDLSWTMTYVSAEYVLYKFDKEGNITNKEEIVGMHTIEDSMKLLRQTENGVSTPHAEGNPFQYLKRMRPEYSEAVDLIVEFWKVFSESKVRNTYNYIKHKGTPCYKEIEDLRGRSKYFNLIIGKESYPTDISDVRNELSMDEMIKELNRFDDEELYPYITKLVEALRKAVSPSPMLL